MLRLILEASTPTVTWLWAKDQTILQSGSLNGTVAATLIPSLQKDLSHPIPGRPNPHRRRPWIFFRDSIRHRLRPRNGLHLVLPRSSDP